MISVPYPALNACSHSPLLSFTPAGVPRWILAHAPANSHNCQVLRVLSDGEKWVAGIFLSTSLWPVSLIRPIRNADTFYTY